MILHDKSMFKTINDGRVNCSVVPDINEKRQGFKVLDPDALFPSRFCFCFRLLHDARLILRMQERKSDSWMQAPSRSVHNSL